jgi:hypothetical protein
MASGAVEFDDDELVPSSPEDMRMRRRRPLNVRGMVDPNVFAEAPSYPFAFLEDFERGPALPAAKPTPSSPTRRTI